MADTSVVYDVYADSTYKNVSVVREGNTVNGQTKIGSFTRPSPINDPLGPDINHTIWHNVREILYPLKQWDMQSVSIIFNNTIPVINVSGVSLNLTTSSVEVGKTVILEATVTPSNADNKNVSWSSSDDTVATVSDGTVTGVKAGTATITVTTTDQNKTATSTITVTAAS